MHSSTRSYTHRRTHVLSTLERNGYSRMLWYSGAPHAVGTTRYSEAIADFSAVIRLDPSNANAYFNRGSVRLCAHPCHVHLRRDRARPSHICAGTAFTPATSAPGLGAALEPGGTTSTRRSRRRTGARLARASRARDLRLHHGARPRHGRLGQALERAALGRRRFPCRGHRPRRDGASRDRQRAGGAGIARRGGRVASDLTSSQRRARESCLARRSGPLR